jgi:hypothetical protein
MSDACPKCGLKMDHIPEGWNSEAMRHALHVIDELRALIGDTPVPTLRIARIAGGWDDWLERARKLDTVREEP